MNKKPKFKIQFDNSNPTYEETKKSFLDLAKVLQRLELENIQKSDSIRIEEKAEILLNIQKDQEELLKFIDEDFDTVFPQVKAKYRRKKPDNKGKD